MLINFLLIVFPFRAVGLSCIEVNASVTRNKSDKKCKNGIDGKLSNSVKAMSSNWGIQTKDRTREQVLIMDEVDGMGGLDGTSLVSV